MLSVTDLSCSRGGRPLFRGLSFTLEPGQWLHLKGANGAGKTTLLRAIVGLSPADEGEVRWQGGAMPDAADAMHGALAYLGHASALKEELTALENLRAMLALHGRQPSEPELLAGLAKVGLRGRERLPVRVLSAGQKRRIVLAGLVLRHAALWVLDEPFTALDVDAIDRLAQALREHVAAGGMALLTSHQDVPLEGGRELVL